MVTQSYVDRLIATGKTKRDATHKWFGAAAVRS
jgi:hypothetical protein